MAIVDRNYIYSIGRVKELEKGLLTDANVDRILMSDDPFTVLKSIRFFKTTEDHENQETFDEIFWRERAYNRKQLHELVVDSPLEDIFLLPYDIENIKLFLKGKLTANEEITHISVEEGKFRKSELLEAIYGTRPTTIPSSIMDDIKVITEQFQTTRRFSLIDCYLNRRLRKLQLDLARQVKSHFIVEYLQHLSDIENITTTIRQKFHDRGRELLEESLLDTGTLDSLFFDQIYHSGWECLMAVFKPTVYSEVVAKAITDVNQETFLAILDVSCAQYLIEFLRNTKQITFGIEPILAFYLARDHELKIVRTILAGKKFGYSQEKLRIRVKELY